MSEPRLRFSPRVFALERGAAPASGADALARLAAAGLAGGAVLLDSAGGAPARYDLVGFAPLAPLPPFDGARPGAAFDALRALLARIERAGGERVPGPFHGGFLGALAYDLGAADEALALPAEPWGFPLAAGGLYVDFVVVDHERCAAWLVLGDEPGDGRPPLAARRDALLGALRTPAPEPAAPVPLGPLERSTDAARHRRRIERARALIAAGELYQVNLAHRFTRVVRTDPIALYARLRALNRAPYMGFVDLGEGRALLSASPELLLEHDGREARTRPIKGTAARALDPREDRARAAALLASPKDRAELAMIVDLERNDLGRVAVPGGVRVEGFPALQTCARVHHLVADVVATTRADVGALDVLAALFPGGSISGAPKLRSMEAIAALEREGRGFFAGSLGFVDLAGRAAFNVLIRTLLVRARPALGAGASEVSFRVGGGITWASQAAAEDEETLHKAASLAAALAGEDEPVALAQGGAR